MRTQGPADGALEALLGARYPDAYARHTRRDGGADRPVLEAVGEGVLFSPLEHAADADSLAVLRPRLSPADKAAALLRGFQYAGRPYDFDFDFRTDAALVCSELVYKAYEPGPGRPGLRLPLRSVLGGPSCRRTTSRASSTRRRAPPRRSSTWCSSSTATNGPAPRSRPRSTRSAAAGNARSGTSSSRRNAGPGRRDGRRVTPRTRRWGDGSGWGA